MNRRDKVSGMMTSYSIYEPKGNWNAYKRFQRYDYSIYRWRCWEEDWQVPGWRHKRKIPTPFFWMKYQCIYPRNAQAIVIVKLHLVS